jgi:hypothetical protein
MYAKVLASTHIDVETEKIMRTPRLITTLLLAALALALFAGSALAYDLTKLKNPSFEKDSNGDGIPNAWAPTSLNPGTKRVCNQSYAGSCSFKMTGDGSINYLVQETLYSSGPAGIQATVSAYTKGKSIVNGGGLARVWVEFNYSGGSDDANSFTLDPGNSPWTLGQATLTATEDFDSITIWLEMSAASGKMWVDKIKVVAVAP